MFTGLIREIGTVAGISLRSGGAETEISCPKSLPGISVGDSIAVDGVCLTARALTRNGFVADLSQETMLRSTLKKLKRGSRVNLEPALAVGDRLGGHLVQGHIDCIGQTVAKMSIGESWEFSFSYSREIDKYLAEKGSVAVNGISLTIASLSASGFSVAVIPHTFENTNLQYLTVGSEVNLEVDIIAKYVYRMLKPGKSGRGINEDFLRDFGFSIEE